MSVPQNLKAVILDCDGILFDVNKEKSQAFVETVKSYPEEIVELFLREHQATGGVSRYEKFAWFFNELCPSENPRKDIDQALKIYAAIVQKAYQQKSPVEDAKYFVKSLFGRVPIFVASGSDQEELRTVFQYHDFDSYFTEILGSPVKKLDNVKKIMNTYHLSSENIVFIGDGGGDYQTTLKLEMPFIYLAEMAEWRPSAQEQHLHSRMVLRESWQDILEDFNVQ